jgi:hypothetical protein
VYNDWQGKNGVTRSTQPQKSCGINIRDSARLTTRRVIEESAIKEIDHG